jgi:hypothetical protein
MDVRRPEFGKVEILFEQGGRHTLEVVDEVVPDPGFAEGVARHAELGTPDGGGPQSLRFHRWQGAAPGSSLEVEVAADKTATAEFVPQ